MANPNIFCNTPWYELQIYWDGSLGICCQEDHKLYTGKNYNIATMSIAEWFNSEPVKQFRRGVLGHTPVSACSRCYKEEQVEGNSRRIKSNHKSVIFRQAFNDSFEQSPGRSHFDLSGTTDTMPIDLHVDLGNYCNLGCKMCHPQASSTVSSQHVKWGIESSRQYLGSDWTKNQQVWQGFLEQLLKIPRLNNIHFMGGETLLTRRFEDLIDFMIQHDRQDMCFSFVTNGTVFNAGLMEKLKQFRRVGIEVSIEAMSEHNAYQRQGTDTNLVLANIERYQSVCNNSSVTLTIRPAISAITIGYFPGLLQFCLDKKFMIKSVHVNDPKFLNAEVLPWSVKQQYVSRYQPILDQLNDLQVPADYNASDLHYYAFTVKEHAQMCVNILNIPEPPNIQELQSQLVDHCRRWDSVYNFNARDLYPELSELWDRYGY